VLAFIALFAALAFSAQAADSASDPVVFTFSALGDSRHDPKAADLAPQDRIWLQNTKVLARMIREIQAQKPNVLFFNGDMIMGYSTNAHKLNREYAYWRGMMASLLEASTYVVPVPGNHEVQIKEDPNDDSEKAVKVAQREGELAWRENMEDLILDTNLWRRLTGLPVTAWNPKNTPPVGGADGIRSDQQQLSFSFDSGRIHFAVINTDAFGNDSHAPVHWLADDLARARERGAEHFFVFGHKMAYTYFFNQKTKPKGLDQFPEHVDAFWKIIEDYHATYFCGHEHIYHSMQPKESGPNRPWQIIAGSAGSPFEAKQPDPAHPNDRMYAWVITKVHQSGRVVMEAFGFDDQFGPTRKIETIELAPARRHS
jgi:hypothetical protein